MKKRQQVRSRISSKLNLCKLRGILRSRVLRVLCDLIKNVSPYLGGQNLTAVELSEYKYVAVYMYVTLFYMCSIIVACT